MYNQNGLVVTPIDDLVKASQGTLIELPPFVEGQPFVARLKRPSMLDTDDDQAMSNLFGVLDAICDACFVDPTYQQLKDNNIQLTDDQLMFVFNYTQRGVTALGSFRSQLKGDGTSEDEPTVQQDAQ